MYAAVKHGLGVARIPCFMPDMLQDPSVQKLAIPLTPSDWSVWVLNHVDLRKTARIQVCRDYLIRVLQQKRDLFQGEAVKPQA